ncbi:MAG: LysR family transcriptional regulator [Rhodoferax sp.]|jgi:DNA-binding transcriptional LysR family regulator|nr:LysR family transcriptional regulator [Rhodoferax sp.]
MNRTARPPLRNRIKLRHLMLMDALSHDPSLHGAASRMHMTQPNATRMLAELEDMLGARLYERSPRGLLATPYGEAVTEQARLLLANVDQIEHTMQSLLEGHAGLVRVGMMASIAPALLAQALTATGSLLTGAQLRIVEGAHDMLAERLRHGELDLVVGRVRPDTALDGLQLTPLVQEEFTAVAGPTHPLARRRRLAFADVLDQAWVLPPAAVVVRQGFDAAFLRECGRAPAQVIESVSLFTNLSLLRSAPLLAIMPATVATELQQHGLLRRLPLPLAGIVGPVVLLRRQGSILNRAAQRLAQALIDTAAQGAAPAGEPRKSASAHQKA